MMLPYLELPIYIGYGEVEAKVVQLKVQPVHITGYHEGYNDAGMFIYVSGQPFQVVLTVEQYEAKIKSYFELINPNSKTQLKKL